MSQGSRISGTQRVLLSCRLGVGAALGSAAIGLVEAGWIAANLPEHFEWLDRRFVLLAGAYAVPGGLLAALIQLLFPSHGTRWLRVQLLLTASGLGLFHLGWQPLAAVWLIGFAALAWSLPRSPVVARASAAGLAIAVLVLLIGRPRFVAGQSPAASSELAAGRPGNVIFLVVDTLRADHLSAWGYRAPGALGDGRTSPVIDEFAQSGWRFAHAYAQAPWTRPSAASYLTGVYPQSHGIATQFDRLDGQTPTLARTLRERGFRTVGFSANPQVSYPFGLTQGFERFWNPMSFFYGQTGARALLRHPAFAWLGRLQGGTTQDRTAPVAPQRGIPNADAASVNRAVFSWAETAHDPDQPLFLYVHYLDPHDPYNAPQDTLYGDPDSARLRDESVLHAEGTVPPRPLAGSVMTAASAEERSDLLRRYDTEIRYVDTQIGVLMKRLTSLGIYDPDRDLLIFTSDHGEEFYEHEQWLHGQSLFEEMIRVPLILRGPDIPRGAVESDPVELVDLFPTVLDWLGEEARQVHGRSLFDQDRPRGEERMVYSHRPRSLYPMDMLRIGNQKLVRVEVHPGEEKFMQFDLDADPEEQRDLLQGRQPELFFVELLEQYRVAARAFRREGGKQAALDSTMRESLERLGYLEPSED